MTAATGGWDWHYIAAMVGTLAALLAVYSAILLWAVKALLKRQSDETAAKLLELMERDTSQDDEIDAVRRELNDHKVDVAKNYIRREDALVYFARFEQKVDAIWTFLHERFNGRGS